MVAKRLPCLWPGSHRSWQCRPRGDAGASLEQRERACTCNCLRPILCAELAENTCDMFLGSGERDHQLVGDLLVGGALREQLQDLQLAEGKRLKELLCSLR